LLWPPARIFPSDQIDLQTTNPYESSSLVALRLPSYAITTVRVFVRVAVCTLEAAAKVDQRRSRTLVLAWYGAHARRRRWWTEFVTKGSIRNSAAVYKFYFNLHVQYSSIS
jgi:hypothetical protein